MPCIPGPRSVIRATRRGQAGSCVIHVLPSKASKLYPQSGEDANRQQIVCRLQKSGGGMHTLIETIAFWGLVAKEDKVHETIIAVAFLALLLAPCISAIFSSSSDYEEPT